MTSSHTMNKVERACADLAHDGRPVTFAAIATATGLARSTLYRNAALRAIVEQHQRPADGPLTPLTDEIGLFPIEGVGPDFAVVGASVRG